MEILKKMLYVMKFTNLFVILACLQLSANVYAHQKLFTLNFKDATECLDDAKIDYPIDNNAIALMPAKTKITQQKKHIIKGKVTDENGESLPGVSVVIKGTTVGVSTNIDGNYTLKFARNNAEIVFSFVGMITQTIAYKGQSILNVTLKSSNKQLGEIVVTGYQKLSRERATGAFSVANKKDLDTRITTNLVDKFDGLATGILVDNNDKITIRGASTLYGESDPLIVVDGFVIESDLSSINPDDVESVTILKDASAASIWGTKAANGVIVITTRKAQKGKGVQIEASYYRTIGKKQDYKDLQLMNSSERVDALLDYYGKDYCSSYMNGTKYDMGESRMKDRRTALQWAYVRYHNDKIPDNLKITESEYNAEINRLKNANGFQQFSDHLMRNSIKDQFNVYLRSNGENNSFIGSLVYNNDKASAVGDKSQRVIINLKNQLNVTHRLTVNMGANIVYSESQNNGIGLSYFTGSTSTSLVRVEPWDLLFDENGNKVYTYLRNPFFKEQHDAMGLNYDYNPIDEVANNDNTIKGLSTRLQFGINYKLIDGLSFSSKFQYERNYSEKEGLMTTDHPIWRAVLNDYYIDGEYVNLPYGGKLELSSNRTSAWTIRNQFDYRKNFNGDKHQITALVGFEARKSTYRNKYSLILGYDPESALGSPYDVLLFDNYDGKGRGNSSEAYNLINNDWYPEINFGDTRERSYYFNGSYLLNNRYTFSASYRLDQASLFGVSDKARNNKLWSMGFSWNALNENFIKADYINRLIFRATYGVNGNRPSASNTALLVGKTKELSSYWGPSGTKYISLTSPANPYLKSERVYTTNFGLDFSLFDSRVRGTLEYYNKKSKDLIGPKKLPSSSGWTTSMINYAEMKNNGVELELTITPLLKKYFRWDIGLKFSYNKNEVTSIDLVPNSRSNYLDATGSGGYPIVGKPAGRIYAYKWGGLDDEGQAQIINNDGETISWSDDYRIYDLDLLNYQGTSVAPYYGSITNVFKYKNLKVGVNFTYKFGHKMWAPNGDNLRSLLYGSQIHKSWANYWKKPGDELITDVPGYVSGSKYTDTGFYYKYADINVLDASYIRLKDINIDYDIPSKLIHKIGLKGATLRFQAKNLWLWAANNWDIDPETIGTSSYDFGISTSNRRSLRYPSPKTFIIGLKVNF